VGIFPDSSLIIKLIREKAKAMATSGASGADPFDFFKSSKRSEVAELELELNHNKVEKRMEALKKVRREG
jgi:hypothetical protein